VAGFGLRAFPSPTFGKVDIDFELAQGRQVEVGIYDAAGRLVRRVFTGPLGAGRHTLDWDGGGARARSGLYFIRLRAGNEEQVERLVRIH
jgi:flagellar hook assembly protein FlgD